MPHHPDPAAIVLQQQQLHQQQQQQQHLGLVRSSKDFMAATANTASSNPSSAIQEAAASFVQERYTHNHHLQDSSLLPPSPLMLNPTIVPSQSSQHQQQLMSSAEVARQQQEIHPHVVHPYPHQLQHYQHLQQQQQQQQTLQHHRSVFHLQQQYQRQTFWQEQQQAQQQLQQDQQDLDEATARGRPGSMEMGFQRKRSLSVPLLLSLNPGGGPENGGHVQGQHRQDGQSGQDLDGDQDMDTDEVASASSSSLAANVSQDNGSDNNKSSPSTALVYDYSNMTLQRESLLATFPRSHRHRAYASNAGKGPQPGHSRHTLYYSGNHHPHTSPRHQYNPFTNRKFPPYQYWAVSAQRDYHLSTIGVLSAPSGARSVMYPSSSTSGSGGAGGSGGGGGGGTGDLFLRAALGGSSGGGVNKSVYRSRLPVHLRHITSRNNRRPAICLTAFHGGEGREDGDMDDMRDKKRHSTSVLPSSTSAAGGSSSTTGLDPRDQGSPPPSTGPGSGAISPSKFTDRDGSANHGGESSSSTTNRGSLSAANRKKLSDWKRVTALSFDREGDPQRTGMVMRLASSDSSSIVAPTTSLSGGSSSSLASSLRGSSSNGRQWLSQRGGLANLFQTNLSVTGGSNGSGNDGGAGAGSSGGNVDRLVEEMTKWSV